MSDARNDGEAAELAQLREMFVLEAEDGLQLMEQRLVAVEADPTDVEALHEIFRVAHTIKGSAAIVGYARVAELAHRVEDVLEAMRANVAAVTPARVGLLLQVVDALRETMAAEEAGPLDALRHSHLLLLDRLTDLDAPDDLTDDVADDLVDEAAGARRVGAPHEAGATDAPPSAAGRRMAERTRHGLRVDMGTLDGMLTLSGEVAVAKGRLLDALDPRHPAPEAAAAARGAAEELDRLLADLHERVMRMRLVPLGPLFRQHLRTVRDVAEGQGKLVRLAIEGDDVEVDATIVEQLRDPLLHLVRNAVDHGIEQPARRHAAGKDPVGAVTLHARHERGSVVVEVRDDGRGLDRDRVLATARARGLVADGAALTDGQVHALLMLPGFSTAATITDVSGRGVGLDVVRRDIAAVRGAIEIESAPGRGTTMRVRLPLTVAIIDGFVVGVHDERFVLPVEVVTECLTLPPDDGGAHGVLNLRGAVLPYIRLRSLFAVPGPRPDRESVVVVRHGGRDVGLVVDELHGETQAVLKPLDRVFHGVAGLAGTTVMGDGRVSLILDVAHLLEQLAA